jgi:hypothetical protein
VTTLTATANGERQRKNKRQQKNGKKTTTTTLTAGLPRKYFVFSRNDGENGKRQRQLKRQSGKRLYFSIDCHTLTGSQ